MQVVDDTLTLPNSAWDNVLKRCKYDNLAQQEMGQQSVCLVKLEETKPQKTDAIWHKPLEDNPSRNPNSNPRYPIEKE